MSSYKRLTFFENKARRRRLSIYKSNLEKYFSLINYDYNGNIVDSKDSRTIRSQINRDSTIIQGYLLESGHKPMIIHYDPPALGGRAKTLNLIDNIFNLQTYNIQPQTVIDYIELSLGVYENDFRPSIFRTFNPFYWLALLLDKIASIPFLLLGRIGFNQEKIENSPVGIVVKWVIKLITLVTTILQFLVFLGIVPQEFSLLSYFRINL